MYHRLKLTPCPHCKATGTLILHGKLYGYAANDDCQKSCRGRRIFCNHRKKRNPGCGHTFSVWAADKIKRLRLSAQALWTFLTLALKFDNKAKALRALKVDLSVSCAYHMWKRFALSQSHIRTALAKHHAPPKFRHSHAAQTIAHLSSAFPDQPCPIVAFQLQLQTAFLHSASSP